MKLITQINPLQEEIYKANKKLIEIFDPWEVKIIEAEISDRHPVTKLVIRCTRVIYSIQFMIVVDGGKNYGVQLKERIQKQMEFLKEELGKSWPSKKV